MKNIDLPADGACQAGSREANTDFCTPVRDVFEAVV